ncbi:MAG: VWA domain-containing protein [Chloroflexota bacterium]
MPKRINYLILGLINLAVLVMPTQAQQALQLRIDTVDIKEFSFVQIALTVRDTDGLPVEGLTQSNFEINEDWQPETLPIINLTASTQAQVSVILTLDTSGSMSGQPLSDAKTASVRFLDRLDSNDRSAMLAFSGQLELEESSNPAREIGFSNESAAIYPLIDSLTANGATPLYDAAFKAVRLASEESLGNRAVLLLTDGRDEDGEGGPGSAVANAESAIREANRFNIPIFVIGLGQEIDRAYLQRLALETGGTYQETPDSTELTTLFQNVADLLKQQYILTYESNLPTDGAMHRLSVTIELADRTAIDEVEFGPLPLIIDTPTPEPTIEATSTPTVTPVPSATNTPTPEPTVAVIITPSPSATEPPDPENSNNALFGLIGGILALLIVGGGIVFFAINRRQAAATAYCRNCGYTLTGPGACPQCGNTHRVQKPSL